MKNIRNSQLRYNLCEDRFASAKVDTVHILELKNNQIEMGFSLPPKLISIVK